MGTTQHVEHKDILKLHHGRSLAFPEVAAILIDLVEGMGTRAHGHAGRLQICSEIDLPKPGRTNTAPQSAVRHGSADYAVLQEIFPE